MSYHSITELFTPCSAKAKTYLIQKMALNTKPAFSIANFPCYVPTFTFLHTAGHLTAEVPPSQEFAIHKKKGKFPGVGSGVGGMGTAGID